MMTPTDPTCALPDSFFCIVVMGRITMSSWSWPCGDCPFRSRMPTTVNGDRLIRTIFPTGSSVPNR